MLIPHSLRIVLEERKALALTPAQKRMRQLESHDSGRHILGRLAVISAASAVMAFPFCAYSAFGGINSGHKQINKIEQKNIQTKKAPQITRAK